MKRFFTPIRNSLIVAGSAFLPIVSFAQVNSNTLSCPQPGDINNLTDLINFFTCILNRTVLPLLVSLAVVFFLWGVIQYVINPASTEEREKGQQYMIWGIIGIFVIVSIWGLVAILTGTFGIDVLIPQLQD